MSVLVACPNGCSQCWEELMSTDPMMDPMNQMGLPPSDFVPSNVVCSTCLEGYSLVYDGTQDACARMFTRLNIQIIIYLLL